MKPSYQEFDEDGDSQDRDQVRVYATGQLTKFSVEILEFYSTTLGKNEALAVCIESLSETLGNLISLVSQAHQQEVVESASLVIQQGILGQQKLIDELAYGQIGHA